MKDEQLKILKEATENIEEFSLKGLHTICKVVDVYDGDTMKIVFYYKDELFKWTIRLYGINTPELRPSLKIQNREEIIQRAKEARDFVIAKCEEVENMVYFQCIGTGKYGRLLGNIYLDKDYTVSINSLLLKNNYAIEYMK